MKTMAFEDADLRGFVEEDSSVVAESSSFDLVEAFVDRVALLGGIVVGGYFGMDCEGYRWVVFVECLLSSSGIRGC